jgi:hypothetical protein
LISYEHGVLLSTFFLIWAWQIFSGAFGETAPSWAFIVADLPGAALACGALVATSRIRDSRRAMRVLLLAAALGIGVCVALTGVFDACGVLGTQGGGLAWILCYGAAFYGAFGLLCTPFFDRLFAATRAEGTCTFLVFASDCCSYVAVFGLLLFKSFGPLSGSSEAQVLRLFETLLYVMVAPLAALQIGAAAYFEWCLPRARTGAAGDSVACLSSTARSSSEPGAEVVPASH